MGVGSSAHPRFPSQRRFWTLLPSAVQVGPQVPEGSFIPAGTGVHLPTDPGTAQETQLPVHAVSQHTPWAQWPLWHSAALAHAWPGGRWPHEPWRHTAGATHSPSPVQLDAQAAAPPQRKGAQLPPAGA